MNDYIFFVSDFHNYKEKKDKVSGIHASYYLQIAVLSRTFYYTRKLLSSYTRNYACTYHHCKKIIFLIQIISSMYKYFKMSPFRVSF